MSISATWEPWIICQRVWVSHGVVPVCKVQQHTHRRVNESWCNAVAADTLAAVLCTDGLGETDDAVLGRDVPGHAAEGDEARDGGNVDNGPALVAHRVCLAESSCQRRPPPASTRPISTHTASGSCFSITFSCSRTQKKTPRWLMPTTLS